MTSHQNNILLLGAGELGTAFLTHLQSLPNTHITLGVRSPSKYQHLTSNAPNIHLISIDTTSPSDQLAKIFASYDTLISATGFAQPPGTVSKLANEVLLAGQIRKSQGKGKLWFFPWQWGVDYDVTGDGEGLMPLFGEQCEVRELLRAKAAESHVKWTVVSTGIFMSFLFEPFWGVVDRSKEAEEGKIVVRALRSWDWKVTVTDVNDIGKVLARVVAGDVEADDRCVYAAGDTVSYLQLVNIIGRVTGKDVEKEEWGIPYLEEDLKKDPDNVIKKYRLVFTRDGVWWNKEGTVNTQLGMSVMDVETYAREVVFTE